MENAKSISHYLSIKYYCKVKLVRVRLVCLQLFFYFGMVFFWFTHNCSPTSIIFVSNNVNNIKEFFTLFLSFSSNYLIWSFWLLIVWTIFSYEFCNFLFFSLIKTYWFILSSGFYIFTSRYSRLFCSIIYMKFQLIYNFLDSFEYFFYFMKNLNF